MNHLIEATDGRLLLILAIERHTKQSQLQRQLVLFSSIPRTGSWEEKGVICSGVSSGGAMIQSAFGKNLEILVTRSNGQLERFTLNPAIPIRVDPSWRGEVVRDQVHGAPSLLETSRKITPGSCGTLEVVFLDGENKSRLRHSTRPIFLPGSQSGNKPEEDTEVKSAWTSAATVVDNAIGPGCLAKGAGGIISLLLYGKGGSTLYFLDTERPDAYRCCGKKLADTVTPMSLISNPVQGIVHRSGKLAIWNLNESSNRTKMGFFHQQDFPFYVRAHGGDMMSWDAIENELEQDHIPASIVRTTCQCIGHTSTLTGVVFHPCGQAMVDGWMVLQWSETNGGDWVVSSVVLPHVKGMPW